MTTTPDDNSIIITPLPESPSISSVMSSSLSSTDIIATPVSKQQQTMDRLLPVVNRLHNIFQRCGLANPIDLPQIVVVGSQSSGKSSVLESIVGFDFLPRGNGVVTRSPILIQLNKLKTEAISTTTTPLEKWVEFLHKPGKIYTSEYEIQEEIMKETERVAGKNKQLSPNALIMKVYSKHVVDLTLIDLPGLTKVPVGDQPQDIEKLVRAMIHSYIEKLNTIILAVHPANTDLATSDALQMARRVDPNGLRTLGVITKLDLMDSGTNGLDMLLGRTIPLSRGYVGVVNRSQSDLEGKISITESRENEDIFFHQHPIYAPHASKMGSQYLASTLSSMLMEHIRNVLPTIRTRLSTQLSDIRKQLNDLGNELISNDDLSAALLHLLTNYASNFSDAIDGRPSRSPVATNELAGGARISYIFHDKFGVQLNRMNAFEELGTDEIRTALRNSTGHRTPLFIPEAAFELLVRRQIHRFLKPALICVDLVYDELTRLAEIVESNELIRFHKLRSSVAECTLNVLRERKTPTIEMVHNLIEMEMSYVNTWHPDFIGGKKAIGTLMSISNSHQSNPSSNNAASGNAESGNGINVQRAEAPDSWVEKNLLGQNSGGPMGMGGGSRRRGGVIGRNASSNASSGNGISGGSGMIMSRQDGFTNNSFESSSMNGKVRVSKSEWMTEEERQELEILKKLLESYFDIVRKRVQDMVPKAIITFLVQKSKDSLQSALVSKLYKPSTVDKLMVEGNDVTQKRKDLNSIQRMLEDALREVNEIRDVH